MFRSLLLLLASTRDRATTVQNTLRSRVFMSHSDVVSSLYPTSVVVGTRPVERRFEFYHSHTFFYIIMFETCGRELLLSLLRSLRKASNQNDLFSSKTEFINRNPYFAGVSFSNNNTVV